MKNLLFSLLERVWNTICDYCFRKRNIEVIHHTKNFILLSKDYDIKINSNNFKECTVQTELRKLFPSLVNKNLFHEFYFPHRLDFATSGIMCIPKNKRACRMVSDAFSRKQVHKYYIAVVRGLFSNELVDLDMPIGEDWRFKEIQKMCTINSIFCTKPRNARTIFLVLEEGSYDDYPATKVLIKPLTGRRHQIRVHCSHLGHTIIGDYTYSNKKDILPHRMYLHSFRLVLPLSLEFVDVESYDPFSSGDRWVSLRQLNEINEDAYQKLEDCVHKQ